MSMDIDPSAFIPTIDVNGIKVEVELIQDCKGVQGHDPYELVLESLFEEGKIESASDGEFYEALCKADRDYWLAQNKVSEN